MKVVAEEGCGTPSLGAFFRPLRPPDSSHFYFRIHWARSTAGLAVPK